MSEIAEKKFPYETEKECKDEFTRNLRNGIIDLLRQTFDLGMEYNEKEMMKDAIEGEVKTLYRHIVYVESVGFDSGSIRENKQDVFAGDKVKVIIIKE